MAASRKELKLWARMWGLTPRWWHSTARLRRMVLQAIDEYGERSRKSWVVPC